MKPEKRKTVEAAAKQAVAMELSGNILVKYPSSAKYKKDDKQDQDGPDIYVGKKGVIAAEIYGRERDGYYLGVLVDWFEPREHGFWSRQTDLIFRVLLCSNTKIPALEGRLVIARVRGSWWTGCLSVVSWNERDFPTLK